MEATKTQMDITTNGILKLSPEIRENMFLKMK